MKSGKDTHFLTVYTDTYPTGIEKPNHTHKIVGTGFIENHKKKKIGQFFYLKLKIQLSRKID
jgi:hypothetical protein